MSLLDFLTNGPFFPKGIKSSGATLVHLIGADGLTPASPTNLPFGGSTGVVASIRPASTGALADHLLIKTSAALLYAIDCANAGASDGYLMLFDAAAVPGDGAVQPMKFWLVEAGGSLRLSFAVPLSFLAGCTAVFSSSGPYQKTASATAFISGDAI